MTGYFQRLAHRTGLGQPASRPAGPAPLEIAEQVAMVAAPPVPVAQAAAHDGPAVAVSTPRAAAAPPPPLPLPQPLAEPRQGPGRQPAAAAEELVPVPAEMRPHPAVPLVQTVPARRRRADPAPSEPPDMRRPQPAARRMPAPVPAAGPDAPHAPDRPQDPAARLSALPAADDPALLRLAARLFDGIPAIPDPGEGPAPRRVAAEPDAGPAAAPPARAVPLPAAAGRPAPAAASRLDASPSIRIGSIRVDVSAAPQAPGAAALPAEPEPARTGPPPRPVPLRRFHLRTW